MNRKSSWVWKCGLVVFPAVFLLAVAGCSKGNNGNGGKAYVGAVEAHPESSELLERSYGYLKRSDRDFIRLAPNYSTLRPFAPDTSIVVQTHSEAEGVKSPPANYTEYLHVRLNRPMSLRFIIADSTGQGLIVYELNKVPVGAYTVGEKGWPLPQIELTKGMSWVYVYVVADTRFRYRTRFRLDDKQHFIPLVAQSQPS